jgi:hypothetical protein
MCFGRGGAASSLIVFTNACLSLSVALLISEMLLMAAVSFRKVQHEFRYRLVTAVLRLVQEQNSESLLFLRTEMRALRRRIDRHATQHSRTLLYALLSSVAWLVGLLVLTVLEWQMETRLTVHLSIWLSVVFVTVLLTTTTYYVIHQIIL